MIISEFENNLIDVIVKKIILINIKDKLLYYPSFN